MTYTVDFRNIEHYADIHLELKQALMLPAHYGENWDAFWDCLTDMYGSPVHIRILGLETVEEKFGEAAKKMLAVLTQFKHQNKSFEDSVCIELLRDGERASFL